jgi:hypothetical protein
VQIFKTKQIKSIKMKTLFTIVLAGLLFTPAFTQEDSASDTNAGVEVVSEESGNTVVTVGSEETVVVDENKDTTRIKIGKKGIIIIEGEKGTQVNIDNLEDEETQMESDNNNESDDESEDDDNTKFKPHWEGFEIGLNNFLNSNNSMSLNPSDAYMDLNTGRSWNFNLNFMQYGFGIVSDKIGLVTGLGAEWNNYHFDNNNSIDKVSGVIQERILDPIQYPDIQKTRLQTTYLRAPLLLEFQIPAGKKRIYFSAGPVAGVKLFSNTKVVYKENGDKQRDKRKDDFNISSLRYGFTARAGYRGLKLFANYYMTPLFEVNKGPELYPFSVGLTLADF